MFTWQNALVVALASASLFLFSRASHADSPVTSTPFHEAYLDVDIVRQAARAGTLNRAIARYLSSPRNPIGIKAAVINALSWDVEGKNNAQLYSNYLAEAYGRPVDDLDPDILHPDEVFALGYLTLLDDYFDPARAIPLLERAARRRPNSFTVSIILAIAKAQVAMDSDWCQVWRLTEEVLENRRLKQDLRRGARRIIVDYMILYKDYCRGRSMRAPRYYVRRVERPRGGETLNIWVEKLP